MVTHDGFSIQLLEWRQLSLVVLWKEGPEFGPSSLTLVLLHFRTLRRIPDNNEGPGSHRPGLSINRSIDSRSHSAAAPTIGMTT